MPNAAIQRFRAMRRGTEKKPNGRSDPSYGAKGDDVFSYRPVSDNRPT